MTFSEVVDQVIELVRTRQRLSYRALKRELDLTEEYLEDLKEELRFSHPQIAEEEGLGWCGSGREGRNGETARKRRVPSSESRVRSPNPVTYTPPHLAERIRAEQAALEARGSTDGETQDHHGPVCRSQRFNGVNRRA